MLPLPPVADDLAGRLQAAAPDTWRAALDAQGVGPLRVLALSPSANAVLALGRSLKGRSPLAPDYLFARHKKLADQAAALAAKPPGAAAGTPGRVLALADGGSLDLSSLTLLVIDTARDPKQRTLLTLPETAADVAGLLKRHVAGRVAAGECRVALFDSAGGGVAAGKAKGAVWRGKKKNEKKGG
jgi:U3-containing 90S pre-ribosomal complex subunit